VAECEQTQGEVFFPLSFDPGEEAQVDWGEGWVIENSIERSHCARTGWLDCHIYPKP